MRRITKENKYMGWVRFRRKIVSVLFAGQTSNIYDNSFRGPLSYRDRACYTYSYAQVEVGSRLHLDCPVTQLSERPGTVMLWKKGHRVLTAGGIKVRRDPRMSLEGTDLTIKEVGVHDGGLYRCEVEQDTDQPLAVVHTVEILGEISIHYKHYILSYFITLNYNTLQYIILQRGCCPFE